MKIEHVPICKTRLDKVEGNVVELLILEQGEKFMLRFMIYLPEEVRKPLSQ